MIIPEQCDNRCSIIDYLQVYTIFSRIGSIFLSVIAVILIYWSSTIYGTPNICPIFANNDALCPTLIAK